MRSWSVLSFLLIGIVLIGSLGYLKTIPIDLKYADVGRGPASEAQPRTAPGKLAAMLKEMGLRSIEDILGLHKNPGAYLEQELVKAVAQDKGSSTSRERNRLFAESERISNVIDQNITRLEKEISDLKKVIEEPRRGCCQQDNRSLLVEKENILKRARAAKAKITADQEGFTKIPIESLGSFSGLLDGIDYVRMKEEERIQFLKEIYIPSLKRANFTDDEILKALRAGQFENPVAIKGSAIDPNQPRIDPDQPWLIPSAKCRGRSHRDPWQKASEEQRKEALCGPQVHREGCTSSTESFLKYLNVERKPGKSGAFDQRLPTYRSPRLQGPTDACVGFALAEDLHAAMESKALFSDLSPSIDGFQLYNQLNSTPAKCTVDSGLNNSSLKDFTTARERKGGTIMPMAMERIKSHPICLEGGVGQIRVKKTATLVATDPSAQFDFNFFESLINSDRGAMLFISTEVGVEQEDWLKYTCDSMDHSVYLVGVGQGISPFSGKEEKYVIVRDSFRSTAREYKVPFENLKAVLRGVFKASDIEFVSSTSPDVPFRPRGDGSSQGAQGAD